MSGGGGSNTTVKEKSEPWSGLKEPLLYGYDQAREIYDSGGAQYYPGQTYTDPTGLEQLSQAQLLGYSQNTMPGLFDSMAAANQSMLNATDVAGNPYVGAMADTITGRLNDNLDQTIAGIGRGAVAAGQFGGSRHGIMEGQAVKGNQQALGDSLAQLYSDAYGQGLEQQRAGALLMPQTMQTGMLPAMTMGGVGEWTRGQNDMALQADMNRWNYNQNLPQTNLNNYIAALAGVPTSWGGTTKSDGGSNTFGNVVGGGMMGASLAPMMGINPLLAVAGGGLMGGLFG